MNRIAPYRKRQSGQSFTEFVIVFPIFMLIVLFCVQFSMIMMTHSALNLAAFHAGRKFALTRSVSLAKKTAETFLNPKEKGKIKVAASDFSTGKEQSSVEIVVMSMANDTPIDNIQTFQSMKHGEPFRLTVSMRYNLLQVPLLLDLFGVKDQKGGSQGLLMKKTVAMTIE